MLLVEGARGEILAEGEEPESLGRAFHGFSQKRRPDTRSLGLDRDEELIDEAPLQRQHSDNPSFSPGKPDLAPRREGVPEVRKVVLERVLLDHGDVGKRGTLARPPHGDGRPQLLGPVTLDLQRHGEWWLSMQRRGRRVIDDTRTLSTHGALQPVDEREALRLVRRTLR